MSFLVGVAGAFVSAKVISFLNNMFNSGKMMYDISNLKLEKNTMKAEILVSNYSPGASTFKLQEIHLYEKDQKGNVTLILKQKLDFDGILLLPGESHKFRKIDMDLKEIEINGEPLFDVFATVNNKTKAIDPFQFYNKLAVYNKDRSNAYNQI
jgi:hypothetical protein